MIDTVFYYVLNISITSCVIGIIIILLRFIKPIPRHLIYALWGLVYIRLVTPITFSSKLSFLNLAHNLIKNVDVATIQLPKQMDGEIKLSLSNSIMAVEEYFPVTYKNQHLKLIFHNISLIWITGVVLSVLIVIIFYYISTKDIRYARHLKENIYVSELVQTPITFGLFRQKIIIPESLACNSEEVQYIILHENIHIKGHDNLKRISTILISCIHWFNPFAWIFTGLFFKDMELSCDLKAVKTLTKDGRIEYAKTLVNMGSGQKIFVSAAFGKSNVKTRVLNIINYKKLTVCATVISFLFIVAITLILLTNPF